MGQARPPPCYGYKGGTDMHIVLGGEGVGVLLNEGAGGKKVGEGP